MKYSALLLCLLVIQMSLYAQVQISGTIVDSKTNEPLAFVNIGHRNSNVHAVSSNKGAFSINIPQQNENDTLVFSLVGYIESKLPLKYFQSDQQKVVKLSPKITQLKEVSIAGEKFKEKKFGLKKAPGLLHFNEASHNPNDTFEIAQLIKLPNTASKITSINVYLDAVYVGVTFRVLFYGFDGKRPTGRIVEREIIKTCAPVCGWTTIDLSEYNIRLKGDVVAALQSIPAKDRENHPVWYNVKIGGFSKTFIRSYHGWMSPDSSTRLGEWQVPPAHYRIFVTALVPDGSNYSRKEEQEEEDTPPTLRMVSQYVKDSFSIFVKLPARYSTHKKYPTIYLLDGNVFFDQIGTSIKGFNKEKLLPEAILIGIGYKDFITGDSLRDRDYTAIKALPTDSFTISGGADKFLAFIEKELIPYIDRTYRTDTGNRTIMGHSLGGHFTLYALKRSLEEKDHLFRNFIAASPSLSYHNQYIIEEFQRVSNLDKSPRRLYMTMGSLEEDEKLNYSSFSKELTNSKFEENLKSKIDIYPDHYHMETAIPSFEKGLLFVLRKD